MQKRILLFLSFIAPIFGLPSFAQKSNQAKSNHVTNERSLLWRITGKGLKTPSYVFGTMHAICTDDYFFTEKMQGAFSETSNLVLEVDLTGSEMTNLSQDNMVMPKGETLEDYFSDKQLYTQFAKKLLERTEIDVEQFKNFKPFVLISALSMKGLTCPSTASYEMNLIEMNTAQGNKVTGLETVKSQFDIFDKMTKPEIMHLLLASLDDNEHKDDRQLIETYKQQDLDGLYAMMSQSSELKGHEMALLTTRNQNWVKKLPALMSENPCFVAVGAAHLPGEFGILNLLRKAGYKVEAVN